MKRKTRIAICCTVGGVIVLFAAVWFGIGAYFFNMALVRGDKSFLTSSASNPAGSATSYQDPISLEAAAWFKTITAPGSAQSRVINQTSFDGLNLVATEIVQSGAAFTGNSGKWAIVIHGYTSDRNHMYPEAKIFYDAGYNILMPDCRASGDSGGKVISMGWFDRLDMKGWVNRLVKDNPDCRILLYGISMGGATVMMTSGEELPPQVKCFIEDCGYTSAWDEFVYQAKQLFGLPPFPIMYMANTVCRMWGHFGLKEASSLNQLAKCTKPMLFIHGDADTFVPYAMLARNYAAKTEGVKDELIVHGAAHGLSYWTAPDEYKAKVLGFADMYM
jgi:fermentation-respiration switch protein FrsA (DUF1100 family)